MVTRNEWGDNRAGSPQAFIRRLIIRPMSPADMERLLRTPVRRIVVRNRMRSDVAAHFAHVSVLRGFEARMSVGNGGQADSAQIGGALFAWRASSSSSKSDFPVSSHRLTSASTFVNVKLAIRV